MDQRRTACSDKCEDEMVSRTAGEAGSGGSGAGGSGVGNTCEYEMDAAQWNRRLRIDFRWDDGHLPDGRATEQVAVESRQPVYCADAHLKQYGATIRKSTAPVKRAGTGWSDGL